VSAEDKGTYIMLNHTFISSGFSNWKDVAVSFKKHQLNACHCEAVDVMITIPATRKEFGE